MPGSLHHDVAGLRLTTPDVHLGRRSVFAHLWPAGVVLAEQLVGPLAAVVAGRRVIELGCGLAASGLAAARAGADVLLTDAEPAALALAEANARANRLRVATEVLRWGEVPTHLRETAEVVLGADVAYDARQRAPLLATIEALLAPGGVAFLTDPERTTRRELAHHTSLVVEPVGRFASPVGLVTSDGSEDRAIVVYRLRARSAV